MYYVITENEVVDGKDLNQINKKLYAMLEETDFRSLGEDKIITLTTADLNFVQDKKRMSMIPMERLYKKDTTGKLMLYFILALQVLSFVRG